MSSILHIIKLVIFFLVIIIFLSSITTNAYVETSDTRDINTEKYEPTLRIKLVPQNPGINSSVNVYANYLDLYGKRTNATLFYNTSNNSWDNQTLRLINGVQTNGTYLGIIPKQKAGSEVKFKVNIEDDLGYSGMREGNYTVENFTISIDYVLQGRGVLDGLVQIGAEIEISNVNISAVPTVDLFYYLQNVSKDVRIVPMTPSYAELTHRGARVLYHAHLPPIAVNTSIFYYIVARDSEGDETKYPMTKFVVHGITANEEPVLDDCNKKINNVYIYSHASEFDVGKQEAKFNFGIGSDGVKRSSFLNQTPPLMQVIDPSLTDSPFKIQLRDESSFDCGSGYESLYMSPGERDRQQNFHLEGDPLSFPFDNYYKDLIIALPYKDLTIDYNRGTKPVNFPDTGFIGASYSTNNPQLREISDCKPNSLGTSNLCEPSEESNFKKGSSLVSVRFNFSRNFTILTLVIPILAIFYLLGALFIFENSGDQIGNRLALTLGIFALIFTLSELINPMKPQTSTPTIGDSLLSIIIISTIVFTISSIISSSPVVQKWFPRRYGWIDGIIFIIISGLVVVLLWNYNSSVTFWLVPIIIIGLGYGLLLRILGVKITKPLWDIFFTRRAKQLG
jgi:hypothetical protein